MANGASASDPSCQQADNRLTIDDPGRFVLKPRYLCHDASQGVVIAQDTFDRWILCDRKGQDVQRAVDQSIAHGGLTTVALNVPHELAIRCAKERANLGSSTS